MIPIWHEVAQYYGACLTLKQTPELPTYLEEIAYWTSFYEDKIREAWEKFKQNPTIESAEELIEMIKEYASEIWRTTMERVLGIKNLSSEQEDLLEQELGTHFSFLDNKLLPDLIKGIEDLLEDFSIFDWRVIVMYSGALWSFGFLSTVTFDGLDWRDLFDLFMFVGPLDEDNCEGPRNCRQHVNQIYTVAEILDQEIIPGRLACFHNCRHILIPIASPLNEEETDES